MVVPFRKSDGLLYEWQIQSRLEIWLKRKRYDLNLDNSLLIYPQFRIANKRPDIVFFYVEDGAIKDIVFIEIKVGRIFEALFQAKMLFEYSNYRFVLCPINDYAKAEPYFNDFQKLNVGLIFMDNCIDYNPQIAIHIKPNRTLLDDDEYYNKLIARKKNKYKSNLLLYDNIASNFAKYEIQAERTIAFTGNLFLEQFMEVN